MSDNEFATFQNAGYMGLYGGETVADIHRRKKLKSKEKILDFMSSSELVANVIKDGLERRLFAKCLWHFATAVAFAHKSKFVHQLQPRSPAPKSPFSLVL